MQMFLYLLICICFDESKRQLRSCEDQTRLNSVAFHCIENKLLEKKWRPVMLLTALFCLNAQDMSLERL